MRWRTQDWIWLMIVTFLIQGMAYVYKDWLMQIVSFGSTFVSIALAAVAIYISVREATKGDQVKDQINVMLGNLSEKLNQMDVKLNNIDQINKAKDKTIDEFSENVKAEIVDSLPQTETYTKEQVEKIVSDKVSELSNNLKSSLNISSDKRSNYWKNKNVIHIGDDSINEDDAAYVSFLLQNIIQSLDDDAFPIHVHFIKKMAYEKNNIILDDSLVENYLYSRHRLGALRKKGDLYYKR